LAAPPLREGLEVSDRTQQLFRGVAKRNHEYQIPAREAVLSFVPTASAHTASSANGDAWASGDCSRRVLRGGSWDHYPMFLRSADCSCGSASVRLNDLGFRVARAQ
jgi:formylglycine-generating enzyme required for sulfatase activity